MRTELVTAAPSDQLRRACERMIERTVSACIVEPQTPGGPPGIVTTRDVLKTAAAGDDVAGARVEEHLTPEPSLAAPDWPLERAAGAMVRGGFRHLPVVEDGDAVGIVSIRDIVGPWSEEVRPDIEIREAMTADVLRVARDTTVHEAARLMVERNTGSAVVEPTKPKRPPGIIAEREVADALARGVDLDTAHVGDHLSPRMTFSAPDWSLRQAAQAMIKGGFLHIVVVDARGLAGVISMRDILRRWCEDGGDDDGP
jgi:CBS domain-containing protein